MLFTLVLIKVISQVLIMLFPPNSSSSCTNTHTSTNMAQSAPSSTLLQTNKISNASINDQQVIPNQDTSLAQPELNVQQRNLLSLSTAPTRRRRGQNAVPPVQPSMHHQYINEYTLLTIPQPPYFTPNSLMKWGLIGMNLNLQFGINNHMLIINIQDPHYLAMLVEEILQMCLTRLHLHPWLLQQACNHP